MEKFRIPQRRKKHEDSILFEERSHTRELHFQTESSGTRFVIVEWDEVLYASKLYETNEDAFNAGLALLQRMHRLVPLHENGDPFYEND